MATETAAQNKFLREISVEIASENGERNLLDLVTEIESKSDFHFAYSKAAMRKLSVSLNGGIWNMDELMKELSEQLHLSIRRVNETISLQPISSRDEVPKVNDTLEDQLTVSGKVTDANGDGLPGATVQEKGSSNGTITDVDGNYNLTVSSEATLVISFVGYQTIEESVGGRSSISVTLSEDISSLEEVVVVAYGIQKKSDVTGSIASVKEEDFNKGVVVNPGQLLQGKVAGVNVSTASGEPGAQQNIIIRGVGSLRSGTTPLYVVDGFVLDNSSTGIASNPLNFINPADIESIEVLKDASASALYGSRAANGVIVITTKKGKEGKSEINFSASTAWSSMANTIDVFSPAEFRTQVPLAGGTVGDFGGNTNWQDELSQIGRTNNINLSMSGASSETFSYFASVGIQDQEGILKNSNLKRYSARLNLNQQALNGKLKVAYNFTGAQTKNLRPNMGSIVTDMLQLNPTIPALTNGEPTVIQDMLNPLVSYDIYSDEAVNNRILANITPSFEIIKGLTYKLNLGVDYSTTTRDIQNEPYALLAGAELGSLNSISKRNENSLVENTLSYNLNSGSHNVNLLGGHSYQRTFEHQKSFSLTGFADNDVQPIYQDQISTTEQPTSLSSFAIQNELQSFFGRLDYSFASKYLFTATMRADGSSKFGENNRYGYFPSFAAGWNITNEDFISSGFIDNLKLRASWGQTGNQEIPSKITQESYTESKADNDTYPLDPNATTLDDYPYGIIYTRLANPDLQWEVSTQTDIGLDFTLFDFRLSGTIDYFSKVSENILLEVVPADPIQPTSTYWTNIQDMQIKNSGVEFKLDYKSNPSKELKFNFGGNISYINNEVINSPFAVLTSGAAQGAGQTGATINGYINGEPIGAFYMKEFIGIGSDGLNQFVDVVPDGQNLENDRTVVGTALPNVLYGFYLNLQYKGFDLGLNFNGVGGNKIFNHTAMSIFNKGNLASSFNTTDFAIEYPEEIISNSNEVSTRYLEDGDFLRLNNATLAYTLTPTDLGLKGMNMIRLSLTGQNLFLLTKYSGYDPEVNTGSAINGVQTFGIDRFTYPTARTILLGLNVSF
ncbi:MAG: SusC/RagA family TonB-linked outer membrane protein [Bacteroidota bacterium]